MAAAKAALLTFFLLGFDRLQGLGLTPSGPQDLEGGKVRLYRVCTVAIWPAGCRLNYP